MEEPKESSVWAGRWARAHLALSLMGRTAGNIIRFGPHAPRSGERVWVDPSTVRLVVERDERPHRRMTGAVLEGDWDLRVQPIGTLRTMVCCEKHWRLGMSWEDAEAFDSSSSRAREVLERRYAALDRMMARMKADRRLLSTTELGSRHGLSWFVRDEILIHIGRGPQIIFGRRGQHRLAAAQILGLDLVPALLGQVHRDEVHRWTDVLAGRGRSRPEPHAAPAIAQ